MSLHPQVDVPVPAARVARAAYPEGHHLLRLRDALGPIYDDARFAPLFPTHGSRPRPPGAWR